MFDKSSRLVIYLTISMAAFIAVSSEYVGHPLNFTQRVINSGKQIYLDYDLRLINGSITAVHFYALPLDSDLTPDPFRLQVWRIQNDNPGFIMMQLAFEKRIVVERSMLGRINKIPLLPSERFKVTPEEHRLGLTNEGSHCIVGFDHESDNQLTFVQSIPGNYPNIGGSVTFMKLPLPYRLSVGVDIEDADTADTAAATTIADSTTELGKPTPEAVKGSSSSLMMNISSQFLCFAALLLTR